jgi:hypothetical protein
MDTEEKGEKLTGGLGLRQPAARLRPEVARRRCTRDLWRRWGARRDATGRGEFEGELEVVVFFLERKGGGAGGVHDTGVLGRCRILQDKGKIKYVHVRQIKGSPGVSKRDSEITSFCRNRCFTVADRCSSGEKFPSLAAI